MTTGTPRYSDRDLMERLVDERWTMLTTDTEVDPRDGCASAVPSAWHDDLEARLAYAAARMAGDGFEGTTDTRDVVVAIMQDIAERLTAYGVSVRLTEEAAA